MKQHVYLPHLLRGNRFKHQGRHKGNINLNNKRDCFHSTFIQHGAICLPDAIEITGSKVKGKYCVHLSLI